MLLPTAFKMKVSQIYLSISTFAVFAAAAPAVPAAVGNNLTADYTNSYCTFYADSGCTQQVGDVAFDVFNEGCFTNSGGYIRCSSEAGVVPQFILVQSPDSDNNCYCQTDCAHFGDGGQIPSPWNTCTAIDLNPAYKTFRIEHDMGSCAANNC
ncbi:hypothetical protein M409DRAFT_54688 [Zasmidium cellare ATCC 36951]|uniref:Uncharacterized protein n=1 Tax=Zasmidium cellare ATCC 36951 TaxID=1080233 RepID=A0A6A6CI78_ZASCE|nr:uncharacterized protein M409DRAFT_54688 [Zasmidium cellare ATCC 36951]KAF2166924.1 hypothetical protein M409DRAFT_54688 [Zasmidium cellare ATCC 36951]